MPDSTVTIIVPTFNRARYLPECLDSLLAQTLPASKIIVVNDGSTDDTVQVIQAYLDRITYHEKTNGGKSTALNLVMPDILSDYVWIFDDDDVALPEAVEMHVRALEANPDFGFSFSSSYMGVTGRDGRIIRCTIQPVLNVPQNEFLLRLLESCFLAGHGSVFVRNSCYHEVGPFDISLFRSQDYDMLLRLSRHFNGIRVKMPTHIYRQHDGMHGSVSNRSASEHQATEWFKYDKMIFRKLYDELKLCEYLPGGRENEPLGETMRRSAILQRMSIMAGKGLWYLATRDLELLVHEEHFASPLSRSEELICHKAMENRLAVQEMISEKSFLAAIRQLRGQEQAMQVRREFARGLYYHVRRESRNGNLRLAAAATLALVRILGLAGILDVMNLKLNRAFQVK